MLNILFRKKAENASFCLSFRFLVIYHTYILRNVNSLKITKPEKDCLVALDYHGGPNIAVSCYIKMVM